MLSRINCQTKPYPKFISLVWLHCNSVEAQCGPITSMAIMATMITIKKTKIKHHKIILFNSILWHKIIDTLSYNINSYKTLLCSFSLLSEMQVLPQSVSRHVHHVLFILQEVVYGLVPDFLPSIEVPVNGTHILHSSLAVDEVKYVLQFAQVFASYAHS